MLNVVCVLRSGGEYEPAHVERLQEQVSRWLTLEHRFVCLTDQPQSSYHSVLLKHDWPKWYSKLELWRPGLFDGPTFYADLDSTIVGPLDNIALGHKFTVLRNVWVAPPHPRIGSGVMAWDTRKAPELVKLYETFRADPKRHMRQPQRPDNLGDQGFIQRHTPIEPERWQDKYPGRVVSWRKNCPDGIVPKGASIICFGGKVRPWRPA